MKTADVCLSAAAPSACNWGGMFDAPPLYCEVRFCERAAAAFGDDSREEFRYALAHCWDDNLPLWLWVMFNPSSATEFESDRTVDRCLHFTRRLSQQKAGGFVIVNLFAFRTTHPEDIDYYSDPSPDVGRSNDEWMRLILESGRISRIVVAWGNCGHRTERRKMVMRFLRKQADARGIPISQLGCGTRHGAPSHPARLSNDSPLCPYRE